MKTKVRLLLKIYIYPLFYSLNQDVQFLFCYYPHGFIRKTEFLVKKYFLLAKHLLLRVPPKPGKSRVKIGCQRIYYESSFGIAGLQTTIVNIEKNYLKYLRPLKKPLIIDVGAHVGFYSLTLAAHLNKPQIYACEPVTLTFKLLQKNCLKTNQIKPINVGFFSKGVAKKIYYLKNLLMYSSLFPERFLWAKKFSSEIVRLKSLDDFVKENKIKIVDFLKIDAEGAEEAILQGARNTLRKTHYLALEIPLDQVGRVTFSSLMRHLHQQNYNFQLVKIGNVLYGPSGQLLTCDLLLKNIMFKKLTSFSGKNKQSGGQRKKRN